MRLRMVVDMRTLQNWLVVLLLVLAAVGIYLDWSLLLRFLHVFG
ncbi:hypothetical protein KDK_10900 [Dictyobacter kobayashii]|uniref:Uncharacterized protein n=1 Tax=Dictyobacter kobayashii TaxID=2014872 RepID=A0A402ADV8_9CHLR|nr:hypothetical protein KDK_10900 [Dictyobacter kobayashii]